MASLQEAIGRATHHLGEMSLSQRLAIGLGALLVVGSLIWLGQWAATAEMVPLLDQSLEPDELALVRGGLDVMGEPYRIDGSRVLVRAAANRQAILAALQQAEKLPADTAIGFAELVKEANPWISGQENDRRWTVALQSELARVLGQFNEVRQARVLLNLNARPRGFARQHPESTAGVTLFAKGGEPVARSLALAAARMVAGAVRGLPVRNVQVIDGGNGRVALNWDDEDSGSVSSLHRQRKQLEREKELQIKEQLSFDRNVLVSVSCELDHTSVHVQDATPSEGVLLEEESDNTSTVRNRRSGQPGVQPNVAVEAGAGASGDTSTSERRLSTYTPGMKTSTQEIPSGAVTQIRAAVSLSYSYLASVYRLNHPDAEAPTEAQLEEVFAKQKTQIVAHVAKLVIPPETEQVSVVWHYDILEPEPVAEAGGLDTSLEVVRRYGPASGLGLLALLALGMMMRLAKQRGSGEAFGMEIGLPKEALEAAQDAAKNLKAASRRPGTGGAVGARQPGADGMQGVEGAGEVPLPFGKGEDGVLEAAELDESAVRINRMLEQVSAMTERDGEGVAALVENWIHHSR